jgi:hypothetical protein
MLRLIIKNFAHIKNLKNAVDGKLINDNYRRPSMPITIKDFVLQRQKYLLDCDEIKDLRSSN